MIMLIIKLAAITALCHMAFLYARKRLRQWDPYQSEGRGTGGVCKDLNVARVKAANASDRDRSLTFHVIVLHARVTGGYKYLWASEDYEWSDELRCNYSPGSNLYMYLAGKERPV